jgi:hypothetical protein
MTATGRTLAALAVVALLLASLVAPAGAVHNSDRQFRVQVAADGSATVVLHQSYNLSVPAERETYEAYADNATRLAERQRTFGDRLRRAAANGSARTPRDMAIADVSSSTLRINDTGTVRFQARWVGLANVTETGVVVTEPFASGFDPDATLVVSGPEGYVRNVTAPGPSMAQRNSAFWNERTDLTGFVARFVDPGTSSAADGGNGGDGGNDAPRSGGVGRLVGAVGFALVPALLVVLAAKRRDLMEGAASGGDGPSDAGGGSGGDGE